MTPPGGGPPEGSRATSSMANRSCGRDPDRATVQAGTTAEARTWRCRLALDAGQRDGTIGPAGGRLGGGLQSPRWRE